MDTLTTLITSNSFKHYISYLRTIYSTVLCIATFSSLLLLRCSPLFLWVIANTIVFSVYKFSSSRLPNNLDLQTDFLHPATPPLASDRWHDYLSTHPESEPAEKEVTYAETVEKEDMKVTKEKNMEDTWKTITIQCSSTVAKPSLQKSDTWERNRRLRLQRANEIGLKRKLKKSSTFNDGREQLAQNQHLEEEASKGDKGWRNREVLVIAYEHDDLFRRVENFIKKQHENLRLQR